MAKISKAEARTRAEAAADVLNYTLREGDASNSEKYWVFGTVDDEGEVVADSPCIAVDKETGETKEVYIRKPIIPDSHYEKLDLETVRVTD